MAYDEHTRQAAGSIDQVSAVIPIRNDFCLHAVFSNHVTFYYNQLAAMHIVVGDRQAAINSLNTFFNGHFQNQIIASGEQVRQTS